MFFSNVSPYPLSYNEDGTQRTIKSQALPNGAGLPGLMFVDPAGAEPNLSGNPTLNYQVTGTIRRHIPLYPLGKFTVEPNGSMYVYQKEVIVAINNQWWTARTITVRVKTLGGDNQSTNTISIKYGTQTEFVFLSTTEQWLVFRYEDGASMKISATNATTGGAGNTTLGGILPGHLIQINASHSTVQSGSLDNVCIRETYVPASGFGSVYLQGGATAGGRQFVSTYQDADTSLAGQAYVFNKVRTALEQKQSGFLGTSKSVATADLRIYGGGGLDPGTFFKNLKVNDFFEVTSTTNFLLFLTGNVTNGRFGVLSSTWSYGVDQRFSLPAGFYRLNFVGVGYGSSYTDNFITGYEVTGILAENLQVQICGPFDVGCAQTQAIDNRSTSYSVTINATFLN